MSKQKGRQGDSDRQLAAVVDCTRADQESDAGGGASTAFWVDPTEELIAIFMTQVLPSSAYPVRRELRTMVYTAITDSNL